MERVVPLLACRGKVPFGLKSVGLVGKLVELVAVDERVALGACQNAERQAGTAVGALFRRRRNHFGQLAFRRLISRSSLERFY